MSLKSGSMFNPNPPSRSISNHPLLPHRKETTTSSSTTTSGGSIKLQDISPRSFSPSFSDNNNKSASAIVSASPPPSFYRSSNLRPAPRSQSQSDSQSQSPSRTKPRKIQFAAPPPPIVSSVILPLPSRSLSHNQVPRSRERKEREGLGDSAMRMIGGERSGSRRRSTAGTVMQGTDPLLGLERRERAIQKELQLLLDAQAEGLVGGFGGGRGSGSVNRSVNWRDEQSDAGSSTPTTSREGLERINGVGRLSTSGSQSRTGSGGVTPVRQPKKKVVGLRGARGGLLKDMAELVEVKGEKVEFLRRDIERREDILDNVRLWEERMETVRSELADYSGKGEGHGGGEEALEIASLTSEEAAVDAEIREMEDRLAQMKARKKWLGERIREMDNKRESRLSSYRGALKEVEFEVKDFLKRPPVAASVVMGDEEGFMDLPSHRRTLGMAKQWWGTEVSRLESHIVKVKNEKAALEEGAKMWEDTVNVVAEFENDLRKQMASSAVQDAGMLRSQIQTIRSAIERLEENAKIVEEKGWNLLICAIGAELEAFREGELILKTALDTFEKEIHHGWNDKVAHGGGSDNDVVGTGLNELVPPLESHVEIVEREESEDDGPTLNELLIDHGADDA